MAAEELCEKGAQQKWSKASLLFNAIIECKFSAVSAKEYLHPSRELLNLASTYKLQYVIILLNHNLILTLDDYLFSCTRICETTVDLKPIQGQVY